MVEDLLPPNATPQEKALSTSMKHLGEVPVPIATLWQADHCPLNLLPWLAWTLSVDEWDDVWNETIKRQVIKNSIEVHRHKGTVGAVKKALAATGLDVVLQEWFEYGGAPYTFKAEVNVNHTGIDAQQYAQIYRLLMSTKNTRSHFELTLYLTNKNQIPKLATASIHANSTRVRPYLTKQIFTTQSSQMGVGQHTVHHFTLKPKLTTLLTTCCCRVILSAYQTVQIQVIYPRGTS
ncbi:phage tail protein I [Zooshikella harenae]|uniref:Phage tail protein I n=1 Tax=Zooshikella harenae TaxID=2827238 RepID=A0ABS5ZI40_9GAMM|nr:phage tail protein I [Zooshikella harenae]MBU2713737.1 phage tail protein I [Zooshikella harenae]